MTIEAEVDFSRYGTAAATELTVCIMSVRNDFSHVSAVSPTASALTLQTMVSTPPNSRAAPSIQSFSAAGSATSSPLPHDFIPFAASALTTLPTSSALRAQIATLAPSSANNSAIARPMPLLPPVTSAVFPFSPRSILPSLIAANRCLPAVAPAGSILPGLHLGPVACRLERGGRAVDDRLVVVLAYQHQTDGQAIAHAAGNAHGRMAGSVKGGRVGDHFERALNVELPRCVRGRQRRCLHRQRRHQQQIIAPEHRVVTRAQLAAEVLCLCIEMTAIVLAEILTQQHCQLEAVGQLVGPMVPGGMGVQKRRVVETAPVGPHAVTLHHELGGAFCGDRQP